MSAIGREERVTVWMEGTEQVSYRLDDLLVEAFAAVGREMGVIS